MFCTNFVVTTSSSYNIDVLGNNIDKENQTFPTILLKFHSIDCRKILKHTYYASQVKTLFVSQNLTNWITTDILRRIYECDLTSVYVHLKPTIDSDDVSPRTEANL